MSRKQDAFSLKVCRAEPHRPALYIGRAPWVSEAARASREGFMCAVCVRLVKEPRPMGYTQDTVGSIQSYIKMSSLPSGNI